MQACYLFKRRLSSGCFTRRPGFRQQTGGSRLESSLQAVRSALQISGHRRWPRGCRRVRSACTPNSLVFYPLARQQRALPMNIALSRTTVKRLNRSQRTREPTRRTRRHCRPPRHQPFGEMNRLQGCSLDEHVQRYLNRGEPYVSGAQIWSGGARWTVAAARAADDAREIARAGQVGVDPAAISIEAQRQSAAK